MTDKHERDIIALFTIGDMRTLGLRIPRELEKSRNDEMLMIPRSEALKLTSKCLRRWSVSEEELENFIENITNDVIHDVLVCHQLAQLVYRNLAPDRFFNRPLKKLDHNTPWILIREGRSEEVRAFLAHQAFCGGW